ncbi:hypothetical protein K438DRAFT_1963035 [Mycena galopus ATCC 62051]|nr:hypothetical protein K438DRAFT_1963035 [Mycena galopus ATCC 62051]
MRSLRLCILWYAVSLPFHWTLKLPSQAASEVRNWRSEIGKQALAFLAEFFAREDTADGTKQQRAAFVAKELENMNFVYRDPDNKRGACRSHSILYVGEVRAVVGQKAGKAKL